MTQLMQSVQKKGSMFLLLLGAFMLTVSLSSAVGQVETIGGGPACDGVSCANGQSCGSKCICNFNGPTCLDNT